MKTPKEIKDKAIIIFKALLGSKGRTLWIMAIIGGFFAAQLRQTGRLTLINRDNGSVMTNELGDTEYNEPLNENLCSDIYRDYSKALYNYKVKEGIITKEEIEKRKEKFDSDMKRIKSGDIDFLVERNKNVNAAWGIFVERCESRLAKTAKNGFWWTVGVWSIFSWAGLKIASEIKRD